MFAFKKFRRVRHAVSIVALSSAFAVGAASSASAGVVAHYSFDGTITADGSGNGRDLTTGGGVGQVTGQFGSAADFNGSSYLYMAGATENAAFDFGIGDFALSFWYQSDSTNFQPLVSKYGSGSDQGYAVTVAGSTIAGDVRDTVGGEVSDTRPAADGTDFQHVVFQSAGGILQLYINGTLESSAPVLSNSDATSHAFALGARNISVAGLENFGGTSQKLDGRLDEVWVFDNALTTQEVANLMEVNNLTLPVPAPSALFIFALGAFIVGTRRRA